MTEHNIKLNYGSKAPEKNPFSINGFYYDNQLNNPLLSVTLHPSSEYKGGKFVETSKPKMADTGSKGLGYQEEPIARAVLGEDFNVSINNDFSGRGGDPLGSLITDVTGSLSGYIGYFSTKENARMLSELTSNTQKLVNKATESVKGFANRIFGEETVDSVSEFISPITDAAEKLAGQYFGKVKQYADSFVNNEDGLRDEALTYLNSALHLTGTQFSYFKGTKTTFGNLVMKYTVFSGYDASGEWKDVHTYIKELKDYAAGPHVAIKAGEAAGQQFAFWQLPPGGYRTGIVDIDTCNFGSLRLVVGGYYCIDNLVIRSAAFNYSKTMCKCPDGNKLRAPLSCDVILSLEPATEVSNSLLWNFVDGSNLKTKITEIDNAIKESYQEVKKEVKEASSKISNQ